MRTGTGFVGTVVGDVSVGFRTGGTSLIGLGVVEVGVGATGAGTGGPRKPGPGFVISAPAVDAKAAAATSVAIPVMVSLCNWGPFSMALD
jgi:hypothetical protein